jgi:DNA-binding LytR/AlgR family response regulator
MAMTSGGWRASPRGRLLAAWALFAAVMAVDLAVNAASVVEEYVRSGRPLAAWKAWTWEGTSAFAWLMLAPLVFLAVRTLRPPRVGLAAALAAHALMTVPVSLAHVGTMLAARFAVYAAAGERYTPVQPWAGMLFYEYRKDAVSYVLIAGMFWLIDLALRPSPPARASHGEARRIEVRDRSRTRWLAPEDIDWAQAAGNYVELRGRFGTLLHRRTLAALEEELEAHGFIRIHRSRLVRRAAVASVETKPSGDFDLTLESGEQLGGSRRFRERI